jgi:hypothetical protein
MHLLPDVDNFYIVLGNIIQALDANEFFSLARRLLNNFQIPAIPNSEVNFEKSLLP